mgnify:CR=1 FL=1
MNLNEAINEICTAHGAMYQKPKPVNKINPRLLNKLANKREREGLADELTEIENKLVSLAATNNIWYRQTALQLLEKLDQLENCTDLRCDYCHKIVIGVTNQPLIGHVVCDNRICQRDENDWRDACAD